MNKINKDNLKGFVICFVMMNVISLSLLSFATMKNISIFLNDIKIKINGKIINTDSPAFIFNGRTYVPIRFVAEELNSNVEWNKTDNTVEIDNIIRNKTGNIKGSITWQYNSLIGTKPDTGAKIALIPKNLKPLANNEFFCLLIRQNPQGKNGIYTTNADGYGNYEIQDIPINNYYLLIISNNTKSDLKIQSYDKQRLQYLFTEKGWNNLKVNLKLGKIELKEVQIKENKTINKSCDFGHTYF